MATLAVIDTDTALQEFLDQIDDCPIVPPSLYFDLEGIRLGRTGSISIISVFVQPLNMVYLVDVFILGERAFHVTNHNNTSLKTILEAPSIPKVFFDVRNDSDAMFSHYAIQLKCIKDLQVMELAVRSGPQQYVAGLAKCIEQHANLSILDLQRWKQVKALGGQLWDPKRGGSYQVFNERPIRADIIRYCAQDVVLLPRLWAVYYQQLSVQSRGFWRYMVFSSVQHRIADSQSPKYNPEADSKRYGWTREYIEQEREEWNESLMQGDIDGRWLNPVEF